QAYTKVGPCAEGLDPTVGHRVQLKAVGEVEEEVPLDAMESVGPVGQAHGSEGGRETSASNPDDPERRSSVSHRCMVKATSNPASTVGIDGHVRVVGSRLDRIWIGSWSSVDGARIRHRSTSPVGPDTCRSGSPHGQGSQTAVCCRSMGIGTVPSPPVPGGPPVSSKAGIDHPRAEPTTLNEVSVLESESRSESKPSPGASDASVSGR
ncbi:UNVERIFIED_CONTAM: hypothetical protein K2H54_073926, partial [Gekko kuhli]